MGVTARHRMFPAEVADRSILTMSTIRLADTPTISLLRSQLPPRWGRSLQCWLLPPRAAGEAALVAGSLRGTATQQASSRRTPEGSMCPVATEGSACPVGTTAKPLATRSRQPKRVRATAVACTSIEVAERGPLSGVRG